VLIDGLSDGFNAFDVMDEVGRGELLADTNLSQSSVAHAQIVSVFSPHAQQEKVWLRARAKRAQKAEKRRGGLRP
jgi:hypothetical protein